MYLIDILFVPNLPISWFHISSHHFTEVIASLLHRMVADMPILTYSLFQNLILFNRILIKILFTYLTQRLLSISVLSLHYHKPIWSFILRRSQRFDRLTGKRTRRKSTLNLSNLFLGVRRRMHAGFMTWEDASLVHGEFIAVFLCFINVISIFFN